MLLLLCHGTQSRENYGLDLMLTLPPIPVRRLRLATADGADAKVHQTSIWPSASPLMGLRRP